MTHLEGIWDFISWFTFISFFGLVSLFLYITHRKFHKAIIRPYWCPESIYGISIIWTIVYLILSWAGFRIWSDGGWDVHTVPLIIFVINIVVMHMWYFIFFISRDLFVSFLWSIIVCIICFVNFIAFVIVDFIAALLLLPPLIILMLKSYTCVCISDLNENNQQLLHCYETTTTTTTCTLPTTNKPQADDCHVIGHESNVNSDPISDEINGGNFMDAGTIFKKSLTNISK